MYFMLLTLEVDHYMMLALKYLCIILIILYCVYNVNSDMFRFIVLGFFLNESIHIKCFLFLFWSQISFISALLAASVQTHMFKTIKLFVFPSDLWQTD